MFSTERNVFDQVFIKILFTADSVSHAMGALLITGFICASAVVMLVIYSVVRKRNPQMCLILLLVIVSGETSRIR